MEELNVPVRFNKEIIGFSGSNPICRTIKLINEDLDFDQLIGDEPVIILALSDHGKDPNIVTEWVIEYKKDIDNKTMKSIKYFND